MSFDHAYYQRFYYDSKTAVTNKREMQARARMIAAYALHTGLPTRRILDAGCGTGLMKSWLKRYLPRATYTGIEASEYLCQRYGWQQARLETYKPSAPFDIVVCYDVLQYLDSEAADHALANFGKLCRGVLYFTALTRVDWEHNCDQTRTDPNVHLRSARWYRSRLKRNFREAGCGFWLRRGAPFTVWDLESF
jgi:2-polyprenyl-3-methyl-5-hydroxy-6-metoxy-1,4-benzoquinol methylase